MILSLSSVVQPGIMNDSYSIPAFHLGKLESWEFKLHNAVNSRKRNSSNQTYVPLIGSVKVHFGPHEIAAFIHGGEETVLFHCSDL